MQLNLDAADIELTCPSCGHKFKEKVGRLKNEPTLHCPSCDQSITIESAGLRKGTEAAEQAAANFGRRLKALGKLK